MLVVESYPFAVALCVVTMLCWGSWANTQKLASQQWPFQLFYWDYSIGVLLLTLVFAFTIGSTGEEGRSFLPDISQAGGDAITKALLGGVVFNLANILLVVAIDIAGMAVAFPVGIGLALVIGVITNYLAAPIGDAVILFIGVALIVVAILDRCHHLPAPAWRCCALGRQGPGHLHRCGYCDGLFLSLRGRIHIDGFCQSRGGPHDTLQRQRRICGRPVAIERRISRAPDVQADQWRARAHG